MSDKIERRITEETRARVLELSGQNPGWDEKDIARKLKGTAHELDDWAVKTVLATAKYRDK